MLPRENRLRDSREFRAAFRTGAKGTSGHVIAHLAHTRESHAPRVGFVVSKAVGNAVTRNRVKRRARAWTADMVDELLPGELLVLRALPAAADAKWPALTRSLDRAVRQARRRLDARSDASRDTVSPLGRDASTMAEARRTPVNGSGADAQR